jgi:hypothetical protein
MLHNEFAKEQGAVQNVIVYKPGGIQSRFQVAALQTKSLSLFSA